MKKLKKIVLFLLLPLALLYKVVVTIRHFLYDNQWKKSVKYDIPVICVGNLSFGGTGKTPMTEYLIRMLQSTKKITILSRGYRRKTKGLVIADPNCSAQTIGDEPFQYYRKYPNINVVVDENRVQAISQLSQRQIKTDIFILDDAFQHRKIQAGYNILLTSYNALYTDDYLLPVGTLRDVKSRAKKAECIIVTKCPDSISEQEKQRIISKINPKTNQNVFFTGIKYADFVRSQTESIALSTWVETSFTLVVGIANPVPLIAFLKNQNADFEVIQYPDHHHFSQKEIKALAQKPNVLTTEKDFVRLYPYLNNVYYLPIETFFLFPEQEQIFKKNIFEFVNK